MQNASDLVDHGFMIKPPHKPRSCCPINFGLELFGDKWTLLLLRDLLVVGKSTFKQFLQSEEGIATNILSERLSRLECAGLVTRAAHPADKRHAVYTPTGAGRKLLPVLVEMAYWGATHDAATAASPEFVKAYESDRDGLLRSMELGFDPSLSGGEKANGTAD
ncbi:winged helix-turn-helix transcriptional regulator [Rhizobium acaciae]|uniref:winged helix-turn-helix transcriptional regulator n=1 Tax=Rhizobium acaciae TaxID=2989736 RepID=UPI003F9C8EE0